jgi:hypothetical protein
MPPVTNARPVAPLSGRADQYTQTGVPVGATSSAQIQSIAASVTRTQPWEAAYGGTLV